MGDFPDRNGEEARGTEARDDVYTPEFFWYYGWSAGYLVATLAAVAGLTAVLTRWSEFWYGTEQVLPVDSYSPLIWFFAPWIVLALVIVIPLQALLWSGYFGPNPFAAHARRVFPPCPRAWRNDDDTGPPVYTPEFFWYFGWLSAWWTGAVIAGALFVRQSASDGEAFAITIIGIPAFYAFYIWFVWTAGLQLLWAPLALLGSGYANENVFTWLIRRIFIPPCPRKWRGDFRDRGDSS